ncbi:MAG: TonB-dependent receptor [Verrucomicrobiae bacterium]|nr:TonB-dependent receptor [Verrucomicrobiae bacterium]
MTTPRFSLSSFRLIVITSLAFLSTLVRAQDEAPLESTLDPVVVTGSGTAPSPAPVFLADAESHLDVPLVVTPTREVAPSVFSPYSVATLSADTIVDRLGRTLPELLAETPSVMVQKTAHGQGSPFIRGFTGYRNLALIDGIRLNNSVFRDGPNQYWNTIDPYSVRSIELVKGQGSVLYGSDAIGGTLNVLTARPVYAESGFLSGGRTFGRWSSAEQSYTGRVEGYVSEADQYGFLFGFTGKDYGDLRTAGQGENPNTGYEEWDADLKAEFFLNPDTRLTFLHQQVHQNDAWRTHSTTYGIPWRGTTIGSDQRRSLDQDRHLTYLQLEGNPGGVIDHYLISVSHQRQAEEQYRVRAIGDGRINVSGFDVDTYGTMAQFSSDTNAGYLTYGASYYIDRVDSYRDNFTKSGAYDTRSIQGPVPDDSTYELADVFVQDRISLNDRLDTWLGARATLAQADVGRAEDPVTGRATSFEDEWTSVVGSGRFLYDLDGSDTLALFGGVSQGFRAPNLSDLSRLDLARSGEIETPSPGLDPEKFTSMEIGVRRDLEDTRLSLAYYHTDIKDLIVGNRTGRIVDGSQEVTKINGGEGYVNGFEFEIEQGLTEELTLFGWLSWQDGDLESGGVREPLSRIMPFSAEAGIRWQPCDDAWVELLAYGAAKQDLLPARDTLDTQRIPPGGTSGYVIGTVRGGYELGNGLTLTAALENFTDESYRVHGSGINGPERNFILGVEWKY